MPDLNPALERDVRELERLLKEVMDRSRRYRMEAERQRERADNVAAWARRAHAVLAEIRAGVCGDDRIHQVVRAYPALLAALPDPADLGHP